MFFPVTIFVTCLCGLSAAIAGPDTEASTGPGYEVVHGWPVLPEGHVLGRASGVGVDSHNHVFVFHSAGREWVTPFPEEPIQTATVIMFDGDTGAQLAAWGQGLFIMPHGLTVDDHDNVWVTDVGRHQVFKFSHDGELLLTLGEAGVQGDDSEHFDLPTDVAILPNGSFYVSDGYGNARVVKFSSSGRFEFQWGTPGSGPGEFDLPHGIALDRDGRIYVADRSNSRVQVFSGEGQFIAEWKGDALGRPYGIEIGPDQKAYVVDGGDQPENLPDRSRAFRLGMDGTIEAVFGRFGNYDGQFSMGHDIAVGADGAVYVVDIIGSRVQKFVPR